jgi:hypothetical protein
MRFTPSLSAALFFLAILVGAVVLAALFYRAQLGVDFTDECFYASITNRLVQGGTLFVDEFAPQQLASLLVVPLAWVHRSMVGSTDGLVLFLRWSYLATALVFSTAVLLALRKIWGFAAALLMGLIGVAFVPFNIITFSYNTLAIQLFTASLFLGFHAQASESKCAPYWTFLTGVLFGANLWAYPTFVVPQLVFAVIFVAVTRSWLKTILLAAGWSIFPLALLGYLGAEGVADFRRSMTFCTPNLFGASKLIDVWIALWDMYPYKKTVAAALLVLVPTLIVARRRARPLSLFAIALLLVPYPVVIDSANSAMWYATFFSFTAPLSIAFLWQNRVARSMFLLVWLPSLVGGYVAALTSGNGALAMSIGIFPAMIAALALLLLLIRQRDEPEGSVLDSLISFAVPLVVLGLFAAITCTSIYRDAPPLELTDRVKRGPFAGLYTTAERNALIQDMSQALTSASQPGERVLFFYNFPAGYLLTDLPCASNCSWQNKIDNPQWLGHHRALEYYWSDPRHQPVVIVQLTTNLNDNPHLAVDPIAFGPSDPFVDLVQKRFTLTIEHRHFKIYRRNEESSSRLELMSPF